MLLCAENSFSIVAMFSNICREVAVYVRACDKLSTARGSKSIDQTARKDLLAAYDSLFTMPAFISAGIEKRHFKELQLTTRNSKKSKVAPDTSLHERAVVREAPCSDFED